MRHRTIVRLMTREVVSVRGDTPFKEIVRTLSQNQVTAVPVVDGEGRVVGVVSEGDLLRKTADQAAAPDGLPAVPDLEVWERAKAEGTRAEELMSAPAVCARPDWTVAEAARLMEVQRVKRLVVVDGDDHLLGIVSRRDLLGIFLREDDDIRREIVEDVLGGTLRLEPTALAVEVHDGRVELGGRVPFRGMLPAIERMCAMVDGVVSVSCTRLTYDVDDTERGGGRS
ncbi:CBS domain-containing protein [Streptomyces venezuelae]|uniref:CBS domain-containing protein n=1 Tax=Streptomyces gardneri TaxID=66892 RepID=UPI0006BD89E6|nr:CBS domain-containing protein [Streptomyces gardneri]ALO06480.1 CBS domain-containing protein [Streptomyces venezuelae]QPK43914.1 CBS domain-containing protein [Streptomyces gardneri]WRK35179.1 CBS domain-containing protein [Streptomyces venezuelae]CUM43251.1 Inosine-5'-monophosphate dehydrogenase [Streptomyces venezuelae]